MIPPHIELLERGLRVKNRIVGLGWHPEPHKHFDDGGVAESEQRCAEANRDVAAFLRPDPHPPATGFARERASRTGGIESEIFHFDSPLPSGCAVNDRVEVCLSRPAGYRGDRVVIFHHAIYQRRWQPWKWLLRDLIRRVPVAMMAHPYNFSRTPPGQFPGERVCNPNPWCIYAAVRQWTWDRQALDHLLEREYGLRPAAVIGFSMGGFNTLLAAASGIVDLPLVTIASTNHYAHGVFNGVIGKGIRRGMLEVGIDYSRLQRMTESFHVERHAHLISQPVLYVMGRHDFVDPPPSLMRLRDALPNARTVELPAGHATIVLHRRRIAREIAAHLGEHGVL